KVIDTLLEANYPMPKRTEQPGGCDEQELNGLFSDDLQLLESVATGNDEAVDQANPPRSPGGNLTVELERDVDDAHQPGFWSEVEDIVSTPGEGNTEPDTTWPIDMS